MNETQMNEEVNIDNVILILIDNSNNSAQFVTVNQIESNIRDLKRWRVLDAAGSDGLVEHRKQGCPGLTGELSILALPR